jgi:dUTP pyrophosphatase
LYEPAVQKHNAAMMNDPCCNAGFDLFCPREEVVVHSSLINLSVRAFMVDHNGDHVSFYMYPRSSLSKTPLMLANHTGIIDSGYRGFIMAAVRNLDTTQSYVIEPHVRLFQLCAPTLDRFLVQLISSDEFVTTTTSRGSGGFGSTGV